MHTVNIIYCYRLLFVWLMNAHSDHDYNILTNNNNDYTDNYLAESMHKVKSP